MVWIVFVMVSCLNGNCSVKDAKVQIVDERTEALTSAKCDAAPNCIEPRPGFFVIRQDDAAAKPVETSKIVKSPGEIPRPKPVK